jgi:uncharacterized protein YbjT (DUF2867 family)
VDAIICTLATLIRMAGSQAAFAAVNGDLLQRTAGLAHTAGATRHAIVFSLGAGPKGNFHLRAKAEAEDGVRALGYPARTFRRRSRIDTERNESRPSERLGLWMARALCPRIARRHRPLKPPWIARALLDGVLRELPGVEIVESEQLQPHG